MADTNHLEIYIEQGQRTCRVVSGPLREVYRSTPHLVGLALLQGVIEEGESEEDIQDIQWVDLLGSHGCAVGRCADSQVLLTILPSKARDVMWAETPITAVFPQLLMGMAVGREQQLVRSVLYVLHPPPSTHLSVTAPASILAPFPYGNVYAESGLICWGAVRIGDVKTPQDVEELFFRSGFNNDLFNRLGLAARNLPEMVRAAPNHVLPLPPMSMTIPQAIHQVART